MKHHRILSTIPFIIFATGIVVLAEGNDGNNEKQDVNNARGVFNVLLGGQTFRACHCRCGLSSEDQRRKVGQTLGQGLGLFQGLAQSLTPRLVGGINVDPHALPWLAIIIVQGVVTATGALISDRHILTAASPLSSATASATKVTLGAHDLCVLDTSGNFSVSDIILHPNYDSTTKAHDLALLRLTNVIGFDKNMLPICLPTLFSYYTGQHVTIASWTTPATTCTPKRLRLPILTTVECSKTVTTTAMLTSDKSCIGLIGSNGVICGTDVGAPVQYQTHGGHYEIVGIISGGNVCGIVNSTLFVRVYDHLHWIKEHIKPDCTCLKI